MVFLNENISKDNLIETCEFLKQEFKKAHIKDGFNDCKTIIVVAETREKFKPADLELFDSDNAVVTFYLIDSVSKEVFHVKGPGPLMFGLSYTKYIKKINSIVSEHLQKN